MKQKSQHLLKASEAKEKREKADQVWSSAANFWKQYSQELRKEFSSDKEFNQFLLDTSLGLILAENTQTFEFCFSFTHPNFFLLEIPESFHPDILNEIPKNNRQGLLFQKQQEFKRKFLNLINLKKAMEEAVKTRIRKEALQRIDLRSYL